MKIKQFLQVLLAACLISTPTFAASRSLPDTAKLVPPETMVLINIADVNALQKQFQKTSMYKFYKDPAMAAFFKAFKAVWQKTLRESQDEFSTFISDINSVPSGRLAAAFLVNEQTKQTGEPALLLISQWGKDIGNVKRATDKAVRKAIENGARQEKETVRGHEVITITEKEGSPVKAQEPAMKSGSATMKPSPDRFVGISNEDGGNVSREEEVDEGHSYTKPATPASSPETISYCFLDDVLLAAEDKEALKFVISRVEGGGQSLADNTNYQAAMAAAGPVHDIDLYVNVEQIIKSIMAQESGNQSGVQIANFGLDNVSSLGAAASIGRRSGTPAVVKGLLKINGQKKGVMKMIEAQSIALQVPRFVDASSVSLNIYNISIKNAYDELVKMMSTVSPGFGAAINTPLVSGDENGKGRVELKKDILDYLGPEIIVASSIKKPFSSDQDPAKTITAIAVTDRAAIEKSLALLHGSLSQGKPELKRELLGHTIYIMEMGGFPFMPRAGRRPMADVTEKSQAQPELPKLAFTVTDTHLVFGSEENVAQTIRLLSNKEAGSVTAAPWFVRAKSALPGSVGIAGLSDERTYGEYIWYLLKEQAKKKSGAGAFDPMAMAISGFGGSFDFGLLPGFESVKKYFGVSAQYVVSRPDGYYFEMKQLDLKE
jgi:hypothetical protein